MEVQIFGIWKSADTRKALARHGHAVMIGLDAAEWKRQVSA